MKLTLRKNHRTFGGETLFYSHTSKTTKTQMNFSCFIPNIEKKVDSAIIWLSGLTCTEENFITKSGVQQLLAGSNTMIICPDTSPRGLELPDEHESYDFGSGAGFYVNSKTAGYESHYHMYDYILEDIVSILRDEFGTKKMSIMGHSMGGHGALMIALKNPTLFKSVSAFSPIVNPTHCKWGQKAFLGYLGENQKDWESYDSCELIKNGAKFNGEILIDQGLADEFLEEQLLSGNLEDACGAFDQKLNLRYQEGYDHSFYFIQSFLEDHIEKHVTALSD